MSRQSRRQPVDEDLTIALGLVWGYVHTGQFDKADRLAQGCLEVWPNSRQLRAMSVLAAVEGGWQVEQDIEALADSIDYRDFAVMILRRSRGAEFRPDAPARTE